LIRTRRPTRTAGSGTWSIHYPDAPAALALRVYRQTMRRGEDEKARLRALVEGVETAVGGSRELEAMEAAPEAEAA
jgi:hypothetical protein